jgi:hypothetical protein
MFNSTITFAISFPLKSNKTIRAYGGGFINVHVLKSAVAFELSVSLSGIYYTYTYIQTKQDLPAIQQR